MMTFNNVESFGGNDDVGAAQENWQQRQSAAIYEPGSSAALLQPLRDTNGRNADLLTMLNGFSIGDDKNSREQSEHGRESSGGKAPGDKAKGAEETLDGLLAGKKEASFPNGLKIKKTEDGKYEVRSAAGSFSIDPKDNTAVHGKKTYQVSTDADGSLILKHNDYEVKIAKDGGITAKEDSGDELISKEIPAHGNWTKRTSIDKETKEKTEFYDNLKFKQPFKTPDGYEVKFEQNGSPEGKTTVKTPDGKTLIIENQCLTVIEKGGTQKVYGPQDKDGTKLEGKDKQFLGGTNSDWIVEFPNGVIGNFGHNGRQGIAIRGANGELMSFQFNDQRPYVAIARKGK